MRIIQVCKFFLFSLWLCVPVMAAKKFGIKESINYALNNNLELRSHSEQITQAQADVDLAVGEFSTKLKAFVGAGPITKSTGNALQSIEDNSNWGIVYLGELSIIQPIFTWGRKDDYESAALNGKQVKQSKFALQKSKLRYQVKEAYYGTLYAMSLLDFIQSGKEDLAKVKASMKKRRNKLETYRFEIFLSDIEAKILEVEKANKLAIMGLKLRLGLNENDDFTLAEEWIEQEERELKDLTYYQELAKQYRAEMTQLKAGISAKKDLADAEIKALYPILGMQAKATFAHTSKRQRQQSIFAYDPYNRDSVEFGLGLKWDFAWSSQKAKAAKLRSEAMELEWKQQFAHSGISLEVAKAYLELEEITKKLELANQARKAAKKWLSKLSIGIVSGLGSTKGLSDAYLARAKTIQNYYETIYKHHMAWATLSKVVGKEVDPLLD